MTHYQSQVSTSELDGRSMGNIKITTLLKLSLIILSRMFVAYSYKSLAPFLFRKIYGINRSTELFANSLNINKSRLASTNVLGGPLQCCCMDPVTGFFRDGFCETGPQDTGRHTVCAQVTADFLEYTKLRGNDLSTPAPMYGFPGLKPGDKWCLCASRWKEAEAAGKAPPIYLSCTHTKALEIIPFELLLKYGLDVDSLNSF